MAALLRLTFSFLNFVLSLLRRCHRCEPSHEVICCKSTANDPAQYFYFFCFSFAVLFVCIDSFSQCEIFFVLFRFDIPFVSFQHSALYLCVCRSLWCRGEGCAQGKNGGKEWDPSSSSLIFLRDQRRQGRGKWFEMKPCQQRLFFLKSFLFVCLFFFVHLSSFLFRSCTYVQDIIVHKEKPPRNSYNDDDAMRHENWCLGATFGGPLMMTNDSLALDWCRLLSNVGDESGAWEKCRYKSTP